jgi:hypothetical protein
MIPLLGGRGKPEVSRSAVALSGRGPERQERRETAPRCLQPMREIALEPLEPEPRFQHLMGDALLGHAIVLPGRQPRGLNGDAAVRT